MASLIKQLGRVSARKPAARTFATSAFEHLAAYPATKISTLPNGIRVATESTSAQTATVGVWIDAGSRFESAENNGVAHFLEHMIFNGTARRTRSALMQEVENIGGHLNAYTGREQTVFYAKVFKQDVGQAMDILSDILQNSKFEQHAIEMERGTILRELQEVEANNVELLFDYLHYTAYRGTALGRTILGSRENILKINRDDLLRHIKSYYTGPRLVICGAGAVDHADLVKHTEKMFGNLPNQAPQGFEPFLEPARFTGSDVLHRDDSYDTCSVALAYPTAGITDPDNITLMVIQTLLGSWERSATAGAGQHSSSRMVSDLALGGSARSVNTFNTQYKDTGLFGIHLVAEDVHTHESVDVIQDALATLSHKVDEAHLQEAKTMLKMNLLSQQDGTTNIAEDIGRQMLAYGRRMHPLELVARIDAVDANAVKNVARRFFYDQDHALAAVGNTYELQSYERIRRKSYWLRY